MPKRIALFILGLVIVVAGFLLYQKISGPPAAPVRKSGLKLSTSPTTLPMVIEERDANGRLVYYITAPHTPEPIRDAAQNVIPGHFRVTEPKASFYAKNGRLIQIEADECSIEIAGMPSGSGLAGAASPLPTPGGKMSIRLDQVAGNLTGNVRMLIGATAEGGDDMLNQATRIYLDGPLKLDGASQQLTTEGRIHIRSNMIAADQQGLKAIFEQSTQQLLSLRLGENPNGNQIIVRKMGEKAMKMLEKKKGDAAASAPAVVTATGPAKPTEIPAFRLTFGQDVLARAGDQSLSAQSLWIVFSPDGMRDDKKPPTATAGKPATLLGPNPPRVDPMPLEAGPIAPATPDDFVVTWSGPLELLPVDPGEIKLTAVDELILEAAGTAAKPVAVKKQPRENEQGFEAVFGKLNFHSGQPLVLAPGNFQKVILRGLSIAGGLGTVSEVECGQVTLTKLDDNRYTATLVGPGQMTDRRMDKGIAVTSVIGWKSKMELQLVPDPNDIKGNNLAVRSAKFDGATITRNGAEGFDFNAATMDILLVNVKGSKEPVLEHLLATGGVKVVRRGTKPENQGEVAADRLELLTRKDPGGAAPVLSTMLADGNVVSWRYARDTSAAAASQPADPLSGYRKETLSAAKYIANLAPKAKPVATLPAATATAPATRDALAGLGESFDIEHFVAQGAVQINMQPPSGSSRKALIATGDMMDAYPLRNTAVITAANRPNEVVHVTYGSDEMEGRRVEISKFKETEKSKDTYSIDVPGAGWFSAVIPPMKGRPQATPLKINWNTSMNYDGANQLIVFKGGPVARSPGKFEDQGFVSCEDNITIKLKAKSPATAPAGASRPAAGNDLDFDLDWLQAVGKVEVRGAMYDNADKLVSRVRLSAPGMLKYTAEGDRIDIPGTGYMVIEDNRPDAPGAEISTAGETAFTWNGSLTRDDKGLITITKDVQFIFRPIKPLKFLSDAPAAAVAAPMSTYVHLRTDHLVATPAPKSATTKKADNAVSFGAEGMAKVDVSQGAQLSAGTYLLAEKKFAPLYLLDSQSINVDMKTNQIVVTGTPDDPATINRLTNGAHGTARRIFIDMTKQKLAIRAEGVIGSFVGIVD